MGEPLRDRDVRRAAYGRLLSHGRRCPHTLVVDELGLAYGANRIDIAVINGHIRGLEIKADSDSLSRLPGQIAAYGEVVDRASLIVASRHLPRALEMLFAPKNGCLLQAVMSVHERLSSELRNLGKPISRNLSGARTCSRRKSAANRRDSS